MRKKRLFIKGLLKPATAIDLAQEAHHYLINVLRGAVGDELIVFNGDGGEFSAKIRNIAKKTTTLEIVEYHDVDREAKFEIYLAQGISKGERMDYTVQKATELGVTAIWPMFTERCNVKLAKDRLENRVAHWQQIAISAAEQSGRTKVPKIEEPRTFEKIVTTQNSLLMGDTEATQSIMHLADIKPPVTLLIGPEGGFSDEEIKKAKLAAAKTFSLGPRILRTETAGIIAIALLQARFGGL